MIQNSQKISWEAHEHTHAEKSADWFWIAGILAVTLAVISTIFNNPLFSVLIIVATFTLMLHADKKPTLFLFEINTKGVRIGSFMYPHSSLESFWIEEDEYPTKLFIKSKKLMMPLIIIPFSEDVSQEEVRDLLLDYLQEEEIHEPLIQKLAERIGF